MAAPPSGDLNSRFSSHPSRRTLRTRSPQATHPVSINSTRRRGSADGVVHSFRPKAKPLWLKLLLRLQQGSSLVTLSLILGVLATYGWTVYLQQQWGEAYESLETLKKQERQLVSANELLKNEMAEQAEKPTTGLLLPDPSNAIFLTPAPQRSDIQPKPSPSLEDAFPNKPLGY